MRLIFEDSHSTNYHPMNESTILCPNCGTSIDVNEVIYNEQMKQFAAKELQLNQQLSERRQELEVQQQEIQEQKQLLQQQIQDGVKASLAKEREKLTQQIRQDIETEQSEHIRSLTEQLKEQSAKVKELYAAQATIEQLKRENDELGDKLKAEAQLMINETLTQERDKIRKTIEDANALKIQDKEHVIQQLKEQLAIATRKAEQGSMQSQGEVQELMIEEWLRLSFPLDSIDEVKKGAMGGDVIQTVNSRNRTNCGKIYYESKRTKSFGGDWVPKLKKDMITIGADIGVIVTTARPKDMDGIRQIDGIWVCTFEELKGLAPVLRDTILRVSDVMEHQQHKGDKMVMLYDYLTSSEFKMVLESILTGFDAMHQSLIQEKRAMEKLWKQREKQIEAVMLNTTHFYGSIKGIAGSAVPEIKMLELGGGEERDGDGVKLKPSKQI